MEFLCGNTGLSADEKIVSQVGKSLSGFSVEI
jgi:hypothetical protein